MNIIKGLDRIILILAIIAVVPGFWGGWEIYLEDAVSRHNEATHEAEYEQREELIRRLFPNIPNGEWLTPEQYMSLPALPPQPEFIPPPTWQFVTAGFGCAVILFVATLFGLKGLIRLFAWIVQGFKDEKKDEAPELDQDQTLEHMNQKGDKTN